MLSPMQFGGIDPLEVLGLGPFPIRDAIPRRLSSIHSGAVTKLQHVAALLRLLRGLLTPCCSFVTAFVYQVETKLQHRTI